ncbi:MAG: transposase family protein [Thermomicrobia bacterium]|nr:transposase family protein [Thermomicrobia bacterium]
MAVSPGSTITEHFATLTDLRMERTKEHQLLDILTIALCAIISGADAWVATDEYGKAKREWFATFLTLPNGIPSHDTFGPGCTLGRIRRPRSRSVPSLLPRLGARHRRDDRQGGGCLPRQGGTHDNDRGSCLFLPPTGSKS